MTVEKSKVDIKCDANGCYEKADVSVSFDGVFPQYHFCAKHAKEMKNALSSWDGAVEKKDKKDARG